MIKLLFIGIGIYALYRMSLSKKIDQGTDTDRGDGVIEDIDYEEVDE